MIIKIKNLCLKTIIGVYDWEQEIQREIIINAIIHTDYDQAMKSDEMGDAIDYDVITNNIKDLVANKRFKLIEKMVSDILDLIMQDKRIKKCQLEIDKVGAVQDLESFSVTDIRQR